MLLYVIRHGLAGEWGDPRYPDDTQRPLTSEGHHRFLNTAKLLVTRGVKPKLIASSPLVRCMQTAEILADRLEPRPQIYPLDALGLGFHLPTLIEWANQHAPHDMAWVGHSPDVNHSCAELIGSKEVEIRFAKGAVAAIHFDDKRIGLGTGRLQWLVTAKILGC